jgi:selenocysteine-specific elongation factor
MKKNIIFGTAGHIDHGKTSIVKALTGTDPDRLKEEKERGITLDLGFAFMENKDVFISFVDVPGHEKLIKNMIAGATGFDACIFAVDLKEGIKQQTIEHANILKTLGIKTIVLIGTKSDLVNEKDIESKLKTIELFFKNKGFTLINTVSTSIYKKETIENLKTILFEIASKLTPKKTDLPFLLRIDRIFSVKGFGTVVTGTSISGKVTEGQTVNLLPQNKKIKIKGLHVNNNKVKTAIAGQRVALNLSGISKESIHRGNLITEENSLIYTDEFFVKIEAFDLENQDILLKHNKNISLFIGTAHLTAKLMIYDKKIIKNGEQAYCRLKLSNNYAPFIGERFIIRGKSPQISIAGGKILSISTFNFNKQETLKALTLIDNKNYEDFLNFFIAKHKNGIYIPPILQFVEEKNYFKNFINKSDVIFYDNFLISNTFIKNIISHFQNKINNENEISLDEIKNFGNFPKKIIENIESEIIKIGYLQNFKLEGRKLKKQSKNKFDLLCEKIIQHMEKDITLSNATLISEKFNLDKKTAQNCIKYLNNRSLILQLDKNVWVSKKLYEKILKEITIHCLKYEFIDIKSLKQIVNSPRKILVPILDSLDKTGKFINKDNKRFLKK